MPTIKKRNNMRTTRQRTRQGNTPSDQRGRLSCFIRWGVTSRPHRLMKTSGMQSERRDLHHNWIHSETNGNTLLLLYFRAIFNWASKVIRDCIGFDLLRSVIGLENSRHPLNQSDAKLKPIATWSPAFSRAWGRLPVFTLSSHRLLLIFIFVLIGRYDYFGFGFTTLNRKALYHDEPQQPFLRHVAIVLRNVILSKKAEVIVLQIINWNTPR